MGMTSRGQLLCTRVLLASMSTAFMFVPVPVTTIM